MAYVGSGCEADDGKVSICAGWISTDGSVGRVNSNPIVSGSIRGVLRNGKRMTKNK